MGRSNTGRRCLLVIRVSGRSRVPRPPASTTPFTETLPPLSAPRVVPEMPGPVAQGAARINPPAECCPLPRGASGSVCPHRRLLLPGGNARIAARGRPLPEPPAEPRRARPQGPLQALGAGHSVDDAEPAALDDLRELRDPSEEDPRDVEPAGSRLLAAADVQPVGCA